MWFCFNTERVGIKCLQTIIVTIHSPIILFSYSGEVIAFHRVFIALSWPTLSSTFAYILDSIPSFRISCVPTSTWVWNNVPLRWPSTYLGQWYLPLQYGSPINRVRYHVSCPSWGLEDSDRIISSHNDENAGYHDYHSSVDERWSVFFNS